jgi:hypothetical protein
MSASYALKVERLAAGFADDFADVKEVIEMLLDAGDVGIGTHQRAGCFVVSCPLRFVLGEVRRNLGGTAELVNAFEFAFALLHWLAEKDENLHGLIESFFAFLQPVLQQHLGIGAAGGERARG